MLPLDYISCALTILSTLLVGRRMWQGWLVAGFNSVIICVIGFRTAQFGLIPANLFCLAMYAFNVRRWRKPLKPAADSRIESLAPAALEPAAKLRMKPRCTVNERARTQRSRIRRRAVPAGR